MNATTIGVDLAKNVFVACAGDSTGRMTSDPAPSIAPA